MTVAPESSVERIAPTAIESSTPVSVASACAMPSLSADLSGFGPDELAVFCRQTDGLFEPARQRIDPERLEVGLE